MPQVVAGAALSALAGGLTFSATAGLSFTFAGIGMRFATSLVLGGLSRALTPKPKRSAAPIQQIQQNTFAARQPVESRKHIYGHTRIADIYAHMVGNENTGKLHAILILSTDQITAIDEVWVNDYAIPADWIDADGNVTQGRYAGFLRIRKHLGSDTQEADSVAVAEIPEWTSNHRLRGISYLYITLTKNQDVYPTGVPNFSAIVRGKRILDPRSNVASFTSNISIFCYDYLTLADYGYQTSETNTTNISAQANICDEIVTTADVDINVTSIDTSTSIITLDGDLNKLQWGDRVEVSGAVIPTGLSSATSYYVIIYQVKDTPRIKLATSLANAYADIAIDITSTGTSVIITKTGEPRYHGAYVLNTDESLEDNLWDMLSGMAGRAIYTGGEWKIMAGAYVSPEKELTTSHFTGVINTRAKIPLNERFNSIKGVYTSSLNNYQPDDYPPYKVQSFIDADNGVEYPRDYNLPCTNRSTACQRIAKIEILKSRQEIVFTAQCDMNGFLIQTGDVSEITVDKYGWEQKEFEATGFTFSVSDDAQLSTNLTFRETSSSVYDWSSAEDVSIDPAPNTALPSAFDVEVPTGVAYSSRAITTVDGDTVYSLVLVWDEHPNYFVRNNGFFDIEFKLSSQSDYSPSFSVSGNITSSDVLVSSVNLSYDVRIRARNNLGVRSNWSTITGAIIGSSGGITSSEDWGSVADSAGTSEDWGSVADSAGTSEDWGSV